MPPFPLSPKQMCPYLCIKGAKAAIDFYCQAFGARLDYCLTDPSDGRIGHAELSMGDTRLFLADEYPDFGTVGPDTLGGSPVKFHLEVDDADAFVAQAMQYGATLLRPVKLSFHGDRAGMLADPFGYSWFVSCKVEEVSVEEAQRRWNAIVEGKAS